MPQALKYRMQRLQLEKEWEKLEKIPAWQLEKESETKKRWSKKQGIRAEKFILRHWWIFVISRIRSQSLNIRNTKSESYSEVTLWKMIQDHTQYIYWTRIMSITNDGSKSHGHYFKTTGMCRTSRQMQYTFLPRSKWKMHRRRWKFQSQHVWTVSARPFLWQDYSGEKQFDRESSNQIRLGTSSELGMLIRQPRKKDYSYLCMWARSNWLERNKTFIRLGKYAWEKLIWENQHHSLTMFILVAVNESAK